MRKEQIRSNLNFNLKPLHFLIPYQTASIFPANNEPSVMGTAQPPYHKPSNLFHLKP